MPTYRTQVDDDQSSSFAPLTPVEIGLRSSPADLTSLTLEDDDTLSIRSWLQSHLVTLTLAAIVLLGIGLRLYRAGTKGVWLDEAFSIWVASHPLFEGWMWLIRVDQHPPLYYSLLHFWLIFGEAEARVRLLSALLGIAAIPIMYLLGRRLGGPGLGLVAAFIFSLSPFHVAFAQEVRMYTLLSLAGVLSMYFLVSLLSDEEAAQRPMGQQLAEFWRAWRGGPYPSGPPLPNLGEGGAPSPPTLGGTEGEPTFGYQRDWRQVAELGTVARAGLPPLSTIRTDLHWLGYMLATAAAIYTHNTAIFLPLAQNLFVLFLLTLHTVRTTHYAVRTTHYALLLRNWLLAQLGILLLWSPWLPAFFIHSFRVYREFWIPPPTWETVLGTLLDFSSMFLPPQIPRGTLVGPVFILLFALGLWHFRRQPRWLALLLLLFVVPFAGELLVSLRRPIFYTRTLIWASIPYYLILAGGIMQLRYRPYQTVALIVLIVINGFSLNRFYFHYEKEGWDDAAAYVAQEVAPDDLLLFNATWVQIPFDYYFKRYNKPVAEHGVPADLFDLGILEPKMTEQDLPRLQRLIRGRQRVWLIYSHNWYTDPEGLIPPALSAELSLLERRQFRGLEVRKYGVR